MRIRCEPRPHDPMTPTQAALSALTLCSAMLAATPAQAQAIDVVWPDNGRYSLSNDLPAGQTLELCSKLGSGTRITWAFVGSGPTDFNIRYHLGQLALYSVRLKQATRGQQVLRVAAEQTFCWMWTNTGSTPVALKLSLLR